MGTEGESLRGTTSVRATLTGGASGRAITRQRCNGRARSTPTGLKAVGVPVQRCIPPLTLSPFHRSGALFAAPREVLFLIITVYIGYYI